ncbi:sensor histidine kinase [Actinomadura rudentiformis]|uniref:histidine kinase n=1 Tax=Actinomadura rudentiformis TaxID=359158 RepID=A0A6H9YUX7_9ACTN|nr:ATP-binding protein [Actinomadura rudentiformis]KAB2352417.1 sensor histidine kinase [Actinomadura rudentiformis]
MAAQAGRPRIERVALERAFRIWLVVAIVGGGAWLGTLLAVDEQSRTLVAAGGGGVAALIVSLAIGVAAYYAECARAVRSRLAQVENESGQLERRLQELVDGPLPALIGRLQKGASPDTSLAELRATPDQPLGRLVSMVVEGVAASERSAVQARAQLTVLEDEIKQLADSTLPAMTKRIRGDRASAASVLAELPAPSNAVLERLLRDLADDLAAGERTRASAMAAAASAAARIQAQTTRMLAQLRELEDQYNEDKVFGDLLDLDHHVSQMGRLADSIALLSGGRTGRRWTKPIVLESIIRGAMGRIASYQRVQYHSTSTAAVAGFAAEGVMHVLAELMDNAANFSPHGTAVHVYAEEEGAGVVVTIEDSGLGMRQRERERAERLVSEAADLTSLPGTRLGLAVVGRLAGKHGLKVNFRPSSRGGVGVVVLIPRRLISHSSDDVSRGTLSESIQSAPKGTPMPVREPATVGAVAATPDAGASDDETYLPKRRRGATLTGTVKKEAAPAPKPRDPGARFAAFRESASGRHKPTGDTATDSTSDPASGTASDIPTGTASGTTTGSDENAPRPPKTR